MHIGAFSAHRTFMHCPICKKIHPPEELEEMVPPFSNVGYDVIISVILFTYLIHLLQD